MVQGSQTFNAMENSSIELPDNSAFADMEMSRNGQDLVLQSDNGQDIVIENYFTAEPQPTLEASDGSVLTPELVSAFVQSPEQLAQIETAAGTEPVGAIEELHGEATVTRADGSSEPVTLGTEIYQGDIVETSADGGVNILFIDETSMALSEGARFAVTDYSFDAQTESGTTNFSVLRGVFVFTSGLIGRDDPDDVNIDTPVGSIGIRGTIIAGHINPEGESSISVVEGAIVVRNGAGERTLSEQFETIQVNGFNSEMQDIGVLEPAEVTQAYGSASYVIPSLFSNINDAAKEKAAAEEAEQQQAEEAGEEAEEEVIEEPAEDTLEQKSDVKIENSVDTTLDNHDSDKKEDNKYQGKKTPTNHGHDDRYDDNPLNPNTISEEKLSFNIENKLTENEISGGVAARLTGAPAGVTFTFDNGTDTSDDSKFQIVGNKVILTAAGQSTLNAIVVSAGADGFNQDADFGNYGIRATGPEGKVVTQEFNPVIHDVAVNLHGGGEFNPAFEGKINLGNMNGDADNHDDYALIDNSDNSIVISNALNLTPALLDTEGHGSLDFSYTSIAALGDINNDGFDDAIAGTNNGVAHLMGDSASISSSGLIAPPAGVAGGDSYGHSVSGAGDFNGDGKLDYVVGAPDTGASSEGAVHIHADGIGGDGVIKVFSTTPGESLGDYVGGIGDINGDGKSDVLIGGNDSAYIVYGGVAADLNVGGMTAGNGLIINSGANHTIIGGSGAGDFNGDGFDDFIISMQENGSTNVLNYVVFGDINGNITPDVNLDMSELENPDIAFKINDIGGYDTDYSVRSVGDLNGDGFDDIEIGSDTTGYHVVHGQKTANTNDYLGSADENSISATANDQSLVSSKNFYTDTYTGLSINGDARDNNITVRDGSFRNIDGGNNDDVNAISFDTIRHGVNSGLLDFTNITYEQVSSIERIQYSGDNATIRLTVDNIFNLLKTSEDGTLKIENDGSFASNSLEIDANGGAGALTNDPAGIQAALDEGTDATITHSSGGGFDQYDIGGYTLYIDQAITTTTV